MTASVGFDYSSKTFYWAVTQYDQVLNHGRQDMPLEPEPNKLLKFYQDTKSLICALSAEYDLIYTWIEQPFVNSRSPKAGQMLMRTATYLEIASLEALLTPVTVHPGTWRKKVFGNGRPSDTKATAIKYCADKLSYEPPTLGKTARAKNLDHNFADAACIAHYGQLMQEEHTMFEKQGAELWRLDNLRTG